MDSGGGSGDKQGRHYRVLHMLPDLNMGGGQLVVLRNISYMDRDRFDNLVCTVVDEGEMGPMFAKSSIPVECLDYGGWHTGARTLFRLVRLVRQRQIDLIHVNNTRLDRIPGQLAALALGVPTVLTLHFPTRRKSYILLPATRNPARRLLSMLYQSVDYWSARKTIKSVIAVSKAVRNNYSPVIDSLGVPRRRRAVVHPGLPLDQFDDTQDTSVLQSLRDELGVGSAAPVLVNVARLVDVKAQKWLIEAMARVVKRWPDAVLLIAGDGPTKRKLEEQARLTGVQRNVKLLGTREDIPALLAISDIFVFSSLQEGFGLAPLEAMAIGKPVVAFSLPPFAEFIRDGQSGYLVPKRDAEALATKIIELADDPAQARKMGEAGRRIVQEKFDLRSSVEALERVYLSVLEPDSDTWRAQPVKGPEPAAGARR